MNQYSRCHPEQIDELFRSLADQQRRIVIEVLDEESTPLELEVLAHHIRDLQDSESDDIVIPLLHSHLPQLDAANIVEFDQELKMVREGPRFESALNLLRAL